MLSIAVSLIILSGKSVLDSLRLPMKKRLHHFLKAASSAKTKKQ